METFRKSSIVLCLFYTYNYQYLIVYIYFFKLQDGKSIPIDVKVGDRVLLPEYGGTKIQLDEDDSYTIFKESEILAKVESN